VVVCGVMLPIQIWRVSAVDTAAVLVSGSVSVLMLVLLIGLCLWTFIISHRRLQALDGKLTVIQSTTGDLLRKLNKYLLILVALFALYLAGEIVTIVKQHDKWAQFGVELYLRFLEMSICFSVLFVLVRNRSKTPSVSDEESPVTTDSDRDSKRDSMSMASERDSNYSKRDSRRLSLELGQTDLPALTSPPSP